MEEEKTKKINVKEECQNDPTLEIYYFNLFIFYGPFFSK